MSSIQGSGLSVKNTGASWLVMLPAEGSSLTGGAIPGQFKVKFTSNGDLNLSRSGKCTPTGARAPGTEVSTLLMENSTTPSYTLSTITPRFEFTVFNLE